MAKSTKNRIEEIVLPLVEKLGYIYVDTAFSKQDSEWLLTIFVDKIGGMLLDDCEVVSRAIEPVLDEEDPIVESYCLCVSSPGLDRPLKNKRDYERVKNQLVDVKLYKPFEGKKLFTGMLTGYTENTVEIETDEQQIIFEKNEIAKMCLHLDL